MSKMDPRCQRFYDFCTLPAPQGLLPETLMTSHNPPHQGALRNVDVLTYVYYEGQKLLSEEDPAFTKKDLNLLDQIQKNLKTDIVIGRIKPETMEMAENLPALMNKIVGGLEQAVRQKEAQILDMNTHRSNAITLFRFLISNGNYPAVLKKFYPELMPKSTDNVVHINATAQRNPILARLHRCDKKPALVIQEFGLPRNIEKISIQRDSLSAKIDFQTGFTKACRSTLTQMEKALANKAPIPANVVMVAFGRNRGPRLG